MNTTHHLKLPFIQFLSLFDVHDFDAKFHQCKCNQSHKYLLVSMSGTGWKLESESVLMTPWVLGWAMVSVSLSECKMVSEMVWHCQYEMTLKMETLWLLLRKRKGEERCNHHCGHADGA